jgi:predicted nucleotidyltransferase
MTHDEICEAVQAWAAGEPLIRRVYLFGSRAKGSAKENRDVDIAIFFDCQPSARTSELIQNVRVWRSALQSRLAVSPDIQPVRRFSEPCVWKYLKECRICLYRRGA